jgi:hypothetical protein
MELAGRGDELEICRQIPDDPTRRVPTLLDLMLEASGPGLAELARVDRNFPRCPAMCPV